MIAYSYDHIHLRSRDAVATAQYFEKMFGAKILESVQSDGASRIDLDLNGLLLFSRQARRFRTAPRSRTSAWTTSVCESIVWTRPQPI